MFYVGFTLGLFGSMHCLGMCSPLTLILPYSRRSGVEKGVQICLYFVGKTMAYCLLGVVFGLFGKGLFISEYQQLFSVIMGMVMIVYGLGWYFNIKIGGIESVLLQGFGQVKNSLNKYIRKGGIFSFLMIGFFNGFLPCGLLYVAIFGAIAQGTIMGTVWYMLAFGLGTIPIMLAALTVGNVVSGKIKEKAVRFIPVIVIAVGVLFFVRGLGLDIPMVSPAGNNLTVKEQADCK